MQAVETARRQREWMWAGLAILGIILAMAATELAMGRVLICTCGTVKLWHGAVNSAENSQQLMDWYTLSHVIHGLLFYGATRWLFPRRGLPFRAVVATVVEAAWEIAENSPLIINRYREATMALGYTGDSVVNSVADVLAMLVGFALAARLPVWVSVGLGVAMELVALLVIRDNLTLNVLMLLWPVDAIRVWQAG
ncbi:DUF2585 domain-containing protein [Roseomonas aerophila]|uniref:UPF0314 protein IBL26_03205 n=1 Tax=Teichococcus aerophilus TaxID=1224513 RepID=A0ABR7RH02_9PROT|nr:DUF2585 domain-containing protein [Pseudoroseomonas aerophila]MBC9205830.1 DUF2585 domain-containing protein [Pseudoroseomonas aerophila]